MTRPGKMFSESWHRIAGLKVSLRPTVQVRKQYFRGRRWYVLEDPFNNSFYRLRPEAYNFVSRLRPDRTVASVWEECLENHPDEAPGQEDVQQLLVQLYYANILYFELPADSEKLFQRYQRRRQRELKSKLLGIMFFRLPLLDPDRFLKSMMPLIRLLVSPLGALVWLVAISAGVKVVIDNFDEVTQQAQGILAPDNLLLLYVGLVLVKALHEFGHAVVCRRFGGEVHIMGVMLLVFTPLPYMDATSSWAFRSRWKRAFVGMAGMLTEVFVAALCALLWARTGAGTLHSLAYNIMFIASVSTVLFNANPLLRFDGYYVLSDLLDVPNLHGRSRMHLRHLAERYLFGVRESASPTQSRKEAFWLTFFGIASGIYRVVVFVGIIFFIADKFLLAGLIMALVCVVSWGLVPIYRLVKYLASSPRLGRTRIRAVAVCTLLFVGVASFLSLFPWPNRFRSPGVVESVDHVQVVNHAPGYVKEVVVPSGVPVRKGDVLLRLENPELDFELARARAQWEQLLALEQQAKSRKSVDLAPVLKQKASVAALLSDLMTQKDALVVRARQPGVWVSPKIDDIVGAWLQRGSGIGHLVDPSAFRFSAVVAQDEASSLFRDDIQKAEVRIYGREGVNLDVSEFRIIPYEHRNLPSAALGWLGGGEIPVTTTDDTGREATEPFFQIYAELVPHPRVALHHGNAGKLRFTLQPQPLLVQWSRSLRQLLQKRYQL